MARRSDIGRTPGIRHKKWRLAIGIILRPLKMSPAIRRNPNVHRTTTHGFIDCGHIDSNHSKIVELYRRNLSNPDWNPRTDENVTCAKQWGDPRLDSHSNARQQRDGFINGRASFRP